MRYAPSGSSEEKEREKRETTFFILYCMMNCLEKSDKLILLYHNYYSRCRPTNIFIGTGGVVWLEYPNTWARSPHYAFIRTRRKDALVRCTHLERLLTSLFIPADLISFLPGIRES
jgi:hypothetical protein